MTVQRLSSNEALVNDLQRTVDDAWISESALEILDIVETMAVGEYVQLHDDEDAPVVRVYRHDGGFNIHSVSFDLTGYDIQSNFVLSQYENEESSSFDPVEEQEHQTRIEAARAERQQRREREQAQRERNHDMISQRFTEGVVGGMSPYLDGKGLPEVPADYVVLNGDTIIKLKLNDAYQVINEQGKRLCCREPGALVGNYGIVGDGQVHYIVEGFADACTVHLAMNCAVAFAISCNNLCQVAKLFPTSIIAADNDEAGIKAAKATGLRYRLPAEQFKDFDEMRQALGLDAVREQLAEVAFGEFDGEVTVVTGIPGSGKTQGVLQSICSNLEPTVTVYAVHSISAIAQRASELKSGYGSREPFTGGIFTISSEHVDSVNTQFNTLVERIVNPDGDNPDSIVVLITHKALELIEFLPGGITGYRTDLVIDEIPPAFSIQRRKRVRSDRDYILSQFACEQRDNLTVINGLSSLGVDFLSWKSRAIGLDSSELYALVERIGSRPNMSTYWLDIEHEEPRLWHYYEVEIFNPACFYQFSNVTLIGDDADRSMLVLLLNRLYGMTVTIDHVPAAHDSVSERLNGIYYATGHTFGKQKADNNAADISAIVDGLTGIDLSCSLWLLNNNGVTRAMLLERVGELHPTYTSGAVENGDLQADEINVLYSSPMTHGNNSLTNRTAVIMLYSMKPSPAQSAMLQTLGLTANDIVRWTEYNYHLQNAFRGFLRRPADDATGVLVFPDKRGADYFVDRIRGEFGDTEAELVAVNIEQLPNGDAIDQIFAPLPAGRPRLTDGDALTNAEMVKLSRWRRDMPQLDDFIEVVLDGDKKHAAQRGKRTVTQLYEEWLVSLLPPELDSIGEGITV